MDIDVPIKEETPTKSLKLKFSRPKTETWEKSLSTDQRNGEGTQEEQDEPKANADTAKNGSGSNQPIKSEDQVPKTSGLKLKFKFNK
jgi:hypothetical protein